MNLSNDKDRYEMSIMRKRRRKKSRNKSNEKKTNTESCLNKTSDDETTQSEFTSFDVSHYTAHNKNNHIDNMNDSDFAFLKEPDLIKNLNNLETPPLGEKSIPGKNKPENRCSMGFMKNNTRQGESNFSGGNMRSHRNRTKSECTAVNKQNLRTNPKHKDVVNLTEMECDINGNKKHGEKNMKMRQAPTRKQSQEDTLVHFLSNQTDAYNPETIPFPKFKKTNDVGKPRLRKKNATPIKIGEGEPYEKKKGVSKSNIDDHYRSATFLKMSPSQGQTRRQGKVYGKRTKKLHHGKTPLTIKTGSRDHVMKKEGTKTPRRPRKNMRKSIVIEIESSEDERDQQKDDIVSVKNMNNVENCQEADQETVANERDICNAVGNAVKIPLNRIGIDNDVFSKECKLKIMNGGPKPRILISHGGFPQEEYIIPLSDTSLIIKYFFGEDGENESDIDDFESYAKHRKEYNIIENDADNLIKFIAIKTTSRKRSNLSTSTKQSNHRDDSKFSDPNKGFIILEPRSIEEISKLMTNTGHYNNFSQHLDRDSKLDKDTAKKLSRILLKQDEEEREMRLKSRPRTRNALRDTGGKSNNEEVLLVYPFVTEEKESEEIDEKIIKLKQVSGLSLSYSAPDEHHFESSDTRTGQSRTHYLTICNEDHERLHSGKYLNDTLIDFWMRWIWRKEDPNLSSSHFFSSHFFTTLKEEGPEAVSTWTAKKNIDIFKKKLIFIPINESLHWSLCVVVNPNCVRMSNEKGQNRNELSCILFMDSLKAHQMKRCAKVVRTWLNFEWKRIKNNGIERPFNPESMRVHAPIIPYQDNSWDCGVFVCRYAYGLYQQRMIKITHQDASNNFVETITKSECFDFDMGNIRKWREEMFELLEILGKAYRAKKEREKQKMKENKDKEKIMPTSSNGTLV